MNKLAVAVGLLALAVFSSPLYAQEGGERPAGGQRPGAGQRQQSPIKAEMEKVDDALEAVGKFLAKPDGEAPMAALAEAQAALVTAKKDEPRTTQRQPEADRPAFVADYKVQINKALRGLLDLEDAMLAKDWKAAEKVLAKLHETEKAGHEKFKGKRRGRGGVNGGGEGGGEKGGEEKGGEEKGGKKGGGE